MPEATPTTPKNPTTAPTVQDEMSLAVPIPADLSDERLARPRDAGSPRQLHPQGPRR